MKPKKLSCIWFLLLHKYTNRAKRRNINKSSSRAVIFPRFFAYFILLHRFCEAAPLHVSQHSVGSQKSIFRNSLLVRFQQLEIKNAFFFKRNLKNEILPWRANQTRFSFSQKKEKEWNAKSYANEIIRKNAKEPNGEK